MLQAHSAGGTLPNLNLDDEDDGMGGRLPHSTVGGGIVTPFTYTSSSRSQSPPMPSSSPPPMSQYSDGYAPTLSSAGGYYAAVPQQAQAAGNYYPPAPPSSSGSSAYNPRSAKEREAVGSRSFAVANPTNETGPYDDAIQTYLRSGPRRASQSEYSGMPHSPMASSSSSSGTGGVIVHQDGGRVEPRIEEADEIPPTYDSIPNDQRK
ncbi:hypothetical protein C8F01DRAFT_399026 [Mycena amicta]|nr:hypothetical protein C8F01DRAFT_399026 [Mycena amicta]